MKKTKLFIYPNANPHDHDSTEHCVNTVPLSKKGIADNCVLTGPDEADLFYMGQFKPNDFKFFKGNESRHVCDIEGEGGFESSNRSAIPEWLHNSIITTMGPLKKYSHLNLLFTRPTFSHLLIDIVKNKREDFEFPSNVSFGLRAYLNHKVRALLVYTLHKSEFKKELHVNRKWQGLSKIGSQTQRDFINTMLNNSISLCPRGSGIDSVRLIESCYYNRVPVMISDHDYFLFGEDHYDTSFCYRICKEDMKPDYLFSELEKIYKTPIEELEQRASLAKNYFESIVRDYFNDPTFYFLNWLENKNVRK